MQAGNACLFSSKNPASSDVKTRSSCRGQQLRPRHPSACPQQQQQAVLQVGFQLSVWQGQLAAKSLPMALLAEQHILSRCDSKHVLSVGCGACLCVRSHADAIHGAAQQHQQQHGSTQLQSWSQDCSWMCKSCWKSSSGTAATQQQRHQGMPALQPAADLCRTACATGTAAVPATAPVAAAT